MKEILEAKNVHRVYRNGKNSLHVLKGIDLKINEADFLAIVGPSGAGKSTLLHILGGLDKPTEGEVIFEGENIYNLREDELAYLRNRKIGFVFQFYYLLPEFNVWENILLPTFLNGFKKEKEKEVDFLLEKIGLLQRKWHYPDQLSGGEKQRVAILRALINKPKILFCDEPTGNLDSNSASIVLSLIKEINQRDRTSILLVTHNLDIAKMANKVYYLKEGRIE